MVTIAKTKQTVRMPRFGHRVDKTDPILRGCVGWWPLNDGAGSKAFDLSGNGNNGAHQGTPLWQQSDVGTVALFSGSDPDYIEAPCDDFPLLSCAIWIRLDAHDVTKGEGAIGRWKGANRCWVISSEPNGDLICAIRTSSGNTILTLKNSYSSTDLGKWNMVCFTYDKSNLVGYLNGKEVSIAAQTNSILSATEPLTLGRYETSASGQEWEGALSNARIWNRALSASEVSRLYSEPWAGLEPLSPFSFFGGLSQIYAYYSAAFLQRLG